MNGWRAAGTVAHWTAVTLTALGITQLAPFTGTYATASDAVIAACVGLIGLATTPRKDTR